MKSNPVEKSKQYVVVFKSKENANKLMPSGLAQTSLEKVLSSPTRRVASLPDSIADRLAHTKGVVIEENYPVSVPTIKEMQALNRPDKLVKTTESTRMKEALLVHGADKLHAQGIKGKSSAMAPIEVTIDTGIFPHPDLQADKRCLAFYDVEAGKEVPPRDGHGHGTHCTGIAGASGSVVGMAPESDFIGIKVLSDSGSGSLATVTAGIEKAAEYYDKFCKDSGRTMVCNMSLGGGASDISKDTMHATLKKILDARPGLFFAIAAGNSGPGGNTIGTPGNFKHPQALTVAAMDTRDTVPETDDKLASFSSRGGADTVKGQDAMRAQGLAADGVNVLSTFKDNQIKKLSGTSMATPQNTGAAMLLLDLAGKLASEGKLTVKPSEIPVWDLLRKTATDNPAVAADQEGFGMMHVDKAAELLVKEYGKA